MSKLSFKKLNVILTPLLSLFLSVVWLFIWLAIYGVFRRSFDYPWGIDASPIEPRLIGLLIYNFVEFFFILLFFSGSVYIYKSLAEKCRFERFDKHIYAVFLSVSWCLSSLFSYALAAFFCCPGLFPKVFNKFYWLPIPEFLIFYLIGFVVLLLKVYRKLD